MKRSMWMRRIAAATVLALALAACGGDDEPEDDVTDDTEEPADDADAGDEGDDTEDMDEGDEEAINRPDRDDVLNLGYILPETGDLATLGVPQIQSVMLAIEDINAAGGVLGAEVSLATGDEAGDGAIARETAARLINDGVDGVVGAAASGMSQEIIQMLYDNEIVQCSASNTSPAFSDQDNNGFYFRTVPPDEAVAPIIANEVVGDGYANVAVLARADDYGDALRTLVVESLEEQGVSIAVSEGYNPDTDDFSSLVTNVTSAGADAAVVIGFDESGPLFAQLIEGGMSPSALYGGDGVFGPGLEGLVGTDITGLKVIGAAGGQDFNERLNGVLDDANQGNLIYGGQAYDCAIVIALAAEAAGSADPAVFNGEIENVTSGGEVCTSFADCKELLAAGEDIDYDGASGPLALERPDPTQGQYAVAQFTEDGFQIVGDQVVDLADLG